MDESGLRIRELRLDDIPAGMRLKEAAKWNQTSQDWSFIIKCGTVNLAAVVRDTIVGTITDIKYQNSFHWIGMVLVDPAFRRKGVATRLMRETMDLYHGECPFRLDATPEGKTLYNKLGFEVEQILHRYHFQEPAKLNPPEFGIDCRQITNSDLFKLSIFDSFVFGADRFEILNYLMSSQPSYGWLFEAGGEIQGYCLGRPGSNCDQLGPIVAKEHSIAKSLLIHALQRTDSSCVIIDSYDDQKDWNVFLVGLGFKRQRPLIRMFAGEWEETGHPEYQYAIAGPELG